MPKKRKFHASQRSHIKSTAQEFTEVVKQLQAKGERVLPLHVGQPSTGAPNDAIVAARKAMETEILGYTSAYGLLELRHKIAAHYMNKYKVEIEPEQVIITPGASVAFSLALIGCFDQQATIAIPYPVYAAFLPIIRHLGLNIIDCPTRLENRFLPTIEDLDVIDEKIDGLLLINPSNPSGATMTDEELEELANYCHDRGIRLISDETYHGIYYERFLKETTAVEVSKSAIVINSFSKYYSMPGWRIGWMVAPMDVANNLGNVIRNMYICPSNISQHAAMAALDCQDELDEHLVRYAHNRNILLTSLPKAGFTRFIRPQGAFYFYACIDDHSKNSTQFCHDLLEQKAVATMPGGDFDPINGSSYVRFSFAGATEDIKESVIRIREFCESY